MTIHTLILSGGGGRGAFHAGVYKYLCEANKAGVDEAHRNAWDPHIIVGTSIGAVNGAAIVQGISAGELEQFWLSLREHHIQGLPPGMRVLTRWVSNRLMKQFIGVTLPVVLPGQSTSPPAQDSWPPLPLLPPRLSERLIGRWNNLLDTGPLRETLITRLHLDMDRIARSDKKLLINATNVRTGERVTFSNCEIKSRKTREPRRDVKPKITLERILASCSIPLMYPWTRDVDGEVYWDGAVVANTPLGPSLDAAVDRPIDEPMEAVVVMMTPWWETGEPIPPGRQQLPQDFGEAVTWTLDWALLASFRENLKLTRFCNGRCKEQMAAGEDPTYRMVKVVIVAPEEFLPVTRIIDYDELASRQLIEMGYQAARRAFEKHFKA